jgi:hypothetical protein
VRKTEGPAAGQSEPVAPAHHQRDEEAAIDIINAPRRRQKVTDHLICLGFIPFTYNRLIERLTFGLLCCGDVLRNISAARIGLGRQGAASESSSCDVA